MRQQNPSLCVNTCAHIRYNHTLATVVKRDALGEWLFYCGCEGEVCNCSVSIEEILEQDPTVAILAEMDINSVAKRQTRWQEWSYDALE